MANLSDKERLEVYDLLREAHKSVKLIWQYLERMDDSDESAVDAVDNVLYLAEGYFCNSMVAAREAKPTK